MIKPTLGRIVHYTFGDYADKASRPFAAVVANVVRTPEGIELVDLEVFGVRPEGSNRFVFSVEFGDAETARTWFWPPRDPPAESRPPPKEEHWATEKLKALRGGIEP